jgi:hypothetical protein
VHIAEATVSRCLHDLLYLILLVSVNALDSLLLNYQNATRAAQSAVQLFPSRFIDHGIWKDDKEIPSDHRYRSGAPSECLAPFRYGGFRTKCALCAPYRRLNDAFVPQVSLILLHVFLFGYCFVTLTADHFKYSFS